MALHSVYFRKEHEKLLQEESLRLGIEVNDLIKMRLNSVATEQQTLEDFQEILTKLTERMHRFELILMQLCKLTEANLIDTAYVRGAIETQAARNEEAVRRAEELEVRRLQLARKIREEVERYL